MGSEFKIWCPNYFRVFSTTVNFISGYADTKSDVELQYTDGSREMFTWEELVARRVQAELDDKQLSVEISQEMRKKLRVGKLVEIWWPRHDCSYNATILSVSPSEARLRFDDQSEKTMPVTVVTSRMAA